MQRKSSDITDPIGKPLLGRHRRGISRLGEHHGREFIDGLPTPALAELGDRGSSSSSCLSSWAYAEA